MKNGTCWLDEAGRPIQAHGGMINRFGEKWYWYGEDKGAPNALLPDGSVSRRVDVIGVSCYSSDDLHSWRREGLALAGQQAGYLAPENVCERPKVIYSVATGKYVMWFHCDRGDYTLASAGCAVADRPEGPFTLIRVLPPNRRDCRDMTLFEDPVSGGAYLIHSGDWNKTLYLSELDASRTEFTGKCVAILPEQEREAPAMCYQDGMYYLFTSGCTGWAPNPALYATAPRLDGVFRLIDNPCQGPRFRTTFDGQSACIFRDGERRYLLLDHWQPTHLRDSGYSILPLEIQNGALQVTWRDEF